jgi:hypothetical protein
MSLGDILLAEILTSKGSMMDEERLGHSWTT